MSKTETKTNASLSEYHRVYDKGKVASMGGQQFSGRACA